MYLLLNNFEKCRSYFNSKILSKKKLFTNKFNTPFMIILNRVKA